MVRRVVLCGVLGVCICAVMIWPSLLAVLAQALRLLGTAVLPGRDAASQRHRLTFADSHALSRNSMGGFIPLRTIRGRAERVVFSFAGRWLYTPVTWRNGRYGDSV